MTPGVVQQEMFAPLLRHLLAYKTWLIASAILGLTVTALVLCYIQPKYDAQAIVIVDSRRNKLADAESVLSSIVVDQYQSSLKSELEVILSPDLARHVITSLDLLHTAEYSSSLTHVPAPVRFAQLRETLTRGWDSALAAIGVRSGAVETPPQTYQNVLPAAGTGAAPDAVMDEAIRTFKKSFWAENDPKSLTIRLGYRSASPILAAAVTNAALKQYLADDEELQSAAAARSESWLSERIGRMQADLNAAEAAVEAFRSAHQLPITLDHSPLQQALLQLQSQMVDAQTAQSAAQAKVAEDRAGDLASSAGVLASPLIQSLRQREADLLSEQSKNAATLLPGHPTMLKIADELGRLRNTLRLETDRIAQANDADLRLATAKVNAVSDQIKALRQRIDAENGSDVTLRSLAASAAAKRAVLAAFMARYNQNDGPPLAEPDSRVVSWASVPVEASSPHYALMLAAGPFGFMLLTFSGSLVVERLRRGFRTADEVEDELGLIVAGITPAMPRKGPRAGRKLAATDDLPMRNLALTVRALAQTPPLGGPAKVIMVTSALAEEGKSSVALQLAHNVCASGQRCLLIDGDSRNPTLHRRLGVPATPGLGDFVLDHAPIATVVRKTGSCQFDVLTAGRPAVDGLSPASADAFSAALQILKQDYDVIVIDSGPILSAPESLVLSRCSDMTLFLIKWRQTSREVARKAALLLGRCSAGPCLAVLSQVDLRHAVGRRMQERYFARYHKKDRMIEERL